MVSCFLVHQTHTHQDLLIFLNFFFYYIKLKQYFLQAHQQTLLPKLSNRDFHIMTLFVPWISEDHHTDNKAEGPGARETLGYKLAPNERTGATRVPFRTHSTYSLRFVSLPLTKTMSDASPTVKIFHKP